MWDILTLALLFSIVLFLVASLKKKAAANSKTDKLGAATLDKYAKFVVGGAVYIHGATLTNIALVVALKISDGDKEGEEDVGFMFGFAAFMFLGERVLCGLPPQISQRHRHPFDLAVTRSCFVMIV